MFEMNWSNGRNVLSVGVRIVANSDLGLSVLILGVGIQTLVGAVLLLGQEP